MLRSVFASALLLALFAFPAFVHAGKTGFVWSTADVRQGLIVKQQSPNFLANNCGSEIGAPTPAPGACDPAAWVTNPTSCLWDMDDRLERWGSGSFAGGSTVSDQVCLVADTKAHFVGFRINAPSPNLSAVLGFGPQGATFKASPMTVSQGEYIYQLCVEGPWYSTRSLSLMPIVGANGGIGKMTSVSLTITNLKNQNVKNEGVYFRIGTSSTTTCPGSGDLQFFNAGNDDGLYEMVH